MILAGKFLPRQQGAVLVIVALSLFVIMGMAGLALDLGHLYLDKDRLQNAVDAAALAGAKTLNDQLHLTTNPGTPAASDVAAAKTAATTAATSVFNSNMSGNTQLSSTSSANLSVQFSNTLFDATTSTRPLYVRVSTGQLSLSTWFIQVLSPGTTSTFFSASAVAGITPVTCPNTAVPLMICAAGPQGNSTTGAWGYTYGQKVILKDSSPIGKTGSQLSGNFQVMDIGGSNSQQAITIALASAGSVSSCVGGTEGTSTGTTAPGSRMQPIADGLNTRFGLYRGFLGSNGQGYSTTYPADANTTCYDYNTSAYSPNYLNGLAGVDWTWTKTQGNTTTKVTDTFCAATKIGGHAGNKRRVIVVPIVDCTGAYGGVTPGSGNTQVSVLAMGCFLLNTPQDQQSANPKTDYCGTGTTGQNQVCGSFIQGCDTGGASSNTGNQAFDLLKIQLYKDPLSHDS